MQLTVRNLEYVRAGRDFRGHLTEPKYFIINIINMTIFPNPGLQSSTF